MALTQRSRLSAWTPRRERYWTHWQMTCRCVIPMVVCLRRMCHLLRLLADCLIRLDDIGAYISAYGWKDPNTKQARPGP